MTSEPNQEGNNLINYYQKGLDSLGLCKYEEAISNFNIAIEINPNDANSYYNKGLALEGLGKDKEAVVCFNKAVEANPNDRNYHSKMVLTRQKLGRGQESLDYYGQAIEIEPENIIFHEYKALALQRMGQDKEARIKICDASNMWNTEQKVEVIFAEISRIVFESATIKELRKIEEIKSNKHNFYFGEGLKLKSQGKYEEALLAFDKSIEMNEKSAYPQFKKGLTLLCLNKDQDAVLCFDKAIEVTMTPKNPLYSCIRGRTLRSLNRQEDALADFKKAQEVGKSGEKVFLVSEKEIEYLTAIVDSILELQKEDDIAEKLLEVLDKNNFNIMKFVEDLKGFQIKKENLITKLLEKIEDNYSRKISQERILAVSQLKEDYARLHKEMIEELSIEVDEFYKKSDVQVGDFDISPDNQSRVKEYFKAFTGTFRFVFEGSQAIENENYQLDTGCLLSTFASFALKDTSGITSIGQLFLEVQTNAKKTLELFLDSVVYLKALIGKTAEKIVQDQNKREQILSIPEKELDHHNRKLLQKISKFCEQISEPIDIELYKIIYNTPAAILGHLDANDLIQEYLEEKISSSKVQEEFVEKALKRQRVVESEEIKIKIKKESGKGKCCNIF